MTCWGDKILPHKIPNLKATAVAAGGPETCELTGTGRIYCWQKDQTPAQAPADGDAIVHFAGSDVIHMGDVYFNGFYRFIDASSGGTIDGVVAGCDRALAIAGDRTRFIPGHGPLSGKAELQAYRDMLATLAGRIRAQVAAGRKLEEIVASNVSADFDAKWGNGFIKPNKFVEMVAMQMLNSAR